MEIHEMDVISIKKAMTKGWKQRTAKMGSCQDFCFCGGSEKNRFERLRKVPKYEEQLTVSFITSDFTRLSIEVIG